MEDKELQAKIDALMLLLGKVAEAQVQMMQAMSVLMQAMTPGDEPDNEPDESGTGQRNPLEPL